MANGTKYTDLQDYGRMWDAIQASGRPMVLTVEGSPPADLITHGGYGNAKRVGHDISPSWSSMMSLVDIGAGLWPYAHGSNNATFGGWWNDLGEDSGWEGCSTSLFYLPRAAFCVVCDLLSASVSTAAISASLLAALPLARCSLAALKT